MNLTQRIISALALCALPIVAVSQESDVSVPITVSPVVAEALAPQIVSAGTVHSRNAASLTAGLDGQLQWVAEPGTYVAAGEPVARFDCDGLTLQLEEQQAQVALEEIRARAFAEEVERLEQAQLAASISQIARVRADRDLARMAGRIGDVRVRQTRHALERCVAPAPFAGVVIAQERRGGEDVSRGDVLAVMTDTHQLEVRAAVPVRHLPRVTTGVPVDVSLGELALAGRLRTVVPAAVAASQTFELRVDLPADASAHLAAGQLVTVSIPISSNSALTVPRDAVVLGAEGAFVMRIGQDNRAERVAVRLREASGPRVAVEGSLRAGDRVAVRGAEALDDGEPVAVLAEG